MNGMGRQGLRSSAATAAAASSAYHHRAFYAADQSLLSGETAQWNGRLRRISNAGTDLMLDRNVVSDLGRVSCFGRELGKEEVFSPGLLDIHSMETELLPETYLSTNKGADGDGGLPENHLHRNSFSDKDKQNSVAKIKVVVRKRPLNKKEMSRRENDIITIEPNASCSLTVHETKLKVDLTEYVEKHEFTFDAVLDEYVSNDEVYAETVEPIIPLIFQRTKATCFAYGQTGSGKTYTMQPLPLRASRDILRLMHHSYCSQGFQLCVSFFEIYGGKLFDLLNDRKSLFIREDGKKQVCVVGLLEFKVLDAGMIQDLIEKGSATRSTGTTGANEESSRSHAVLQLTIKRSGHGDESKPPRVVGKLSFIDLAGSERGADTTDNDKQTRMEGAEINKSLLALKECIRALDNDQNHIPFRGSKLTEVLRDSFVGNSRTVMISCISPSSGSCEHTLNTLRYADRVKSLSKGSNSKRDQLLPASDLRDSVTQMNCEGITPDVLNDTNRFGFSGRIEPPFVNADTSANGRIEGSYVAPLNVADLKGQRDHQSFRSLHNRDYYDDFSQLQKQPSWNTKKLEQSYPAVAVTTEDGAKRSGIRAKEKKVADLCTTNFTPDDDLNSLLKEEEDLVTAHRREVVESIDIVNEEMELLNEADQPGNQLDDYIFKLNSILLQKAAGILKLQKQLAHFKKRLNEHNVLVSSDQ